LPPKKNYFFCFKDAALALLREAREILHAEAGERLQAIPFG
jgi:hypothetical protein